MSCRVYTAIKMTGLKAKDITEKTNEAVEAMLKWGLDPVSPWTKEKHLYNPNDTVLAASGDLYEMWKKDKQEILSCHVLCDIDGSLFSRGTGIESGFMRFCLMRPTVYIDPAMVSIRTFESDLVAQSVEHAAYIIATKWATPWKRCLWRLKTVWHPKKVLKRIRREIQGWQ